MMFDSHFKSCETVEECNKVYDILRARTPLESRVFLKRARSKSVERLPTEAELQKRRAFVEAYRKEQAQAKARLNHRYADTTGNSFNSELHDLVARAVADDTNLSHPRRWLSKHSEAVVGVRNLNIPQDARQLISDFKEMINESERALNLRKPTPNPEGDPVNPYHIVK
ncbi:TPA: hypothetical protein NJ746_004565 [Vibrio parahaemolyticus]|nr:hypothetical protein [Vibrio parahaemolyticus]